MSNVETLISQHLDSFKEEYQDISDHWKLLDTKAQANITTCGIFLAGILAFIRILPDQSNGWIDIAILTTTTLSVIALSIACLFSVWALKMRDVPSIPIGTHLNETVDVLKSDNNLELLAFYEEQCERWKTTIKMLNDQMHLKTRALFRGQRVLLWAIVSVVITTLLKTWA